MRASKNVLVILILLLFGGGMHLYAQNSTGGGIDQSSNMLLNSSYRTKHIGLQSDTITLDTLSIQPSSFILFKLEGKGKLIKAAEGIYYTLFASESKLVWTQESRPDSIMVRYRVYPFLFSESSRHKDIARLDTADFLIKPLVYAPSKDSRAFLDVGGVNYNGSFARGLSFGNKQDVVFNSSLNLQLSGTLKDDIEIEAAITDNNIPIQPEGNTQQLQEFDQVFIRIRKEPHELTVGDFTMPRPDAYFLNFTKRLQGANYRGAVNFENGASLRFGASAAVTRGQYRKQQLIPEEGNQGPYRLTGNNGERFIIVLAGSERVFIDGALIERGTENDYIVDYNSGEITFTANRLVTKDIRINIEFEYTERAYFRSLLHIFGDYTSESGRVRVRLNAFSQQDGKNQPVDGTLGTKERNVLSEIGDSVQLAFIPGIDSIAFDPTRILYRVTDSLGFDSVFVYSTNEEIAYYTLTFALVGQGNGNYRLLPNAANGRVYQWVVPAGGMPQGDYEPIRVLVAPSLNQIITLGADWDLLSSKNNNATITGEFALSKADVNTFSKLNDDDDAGIGFKLGWAHATDLSRDTLNSAADKTEKKPNWKILSNASYEFIAAQFRPLERYRPVEFERDWNLGPLQSGLNAAGNDEHWLIGGLAIQRETNYIADRKAEYQFSTFSRPGSYNGTRHNTDFIFREKGFLFTAGGSILFSTTDSASSQFIRPRANISQIIKGKGSNLFSGTTVGIKAELEDNRFRVSALGADSLGAASIAYDLWTAYLNSADSSQNGWAIEYRRRRNRRPSLINEGDLAQSSVSGDLEFSGRIRSVKNHRLEWRFTWRDLQITDSLISISEAQQAYLGRLDYGFTAGKGFFQADFLYELGTGSEPKRSFAYLEVPAGEGSYSWNDYNNNNIAELNEFELSVFTDQANYIRVFTPTDEFIRSDILTFQYSVALQPKALFQSKKGLSGFLNRFSAQSSWQLNRKVLEGAGGVAYTPIGYDYDDKSIDSFRVSNNSLFRNTIWFDRSKPKFGLTYHLENTSSLSIIANGPEERLRREHRLETRAALGKLLNFKGTFSLGRRTLLSDAFVGRDYSLPFIELSPSLSLQSGTEWRITAGYTYESLDNDLGVETLRSHKGSLEGRYSKLSKSTVDVGLSLVLANFEGQTDSPVGFAMLEGLQDGTNLLWNLNYDRRISRNVQLGFNYEGRKTGTAIPAHIGRAQLRAIF